MSGSLASDCSGASMRAALLAVARRVPSRVALASARGRDLATAGAAPAPATRPSTPAEDAPVVDIAELQTGAVFTRRRAFTAHDVASFASLAGDHNPIHVDPDAATAAGFRDGPVVHGMLCASMFSAIIGTRFPERCTPRNPSFRKPVRVGERVRAEVEVTRVGGGRVMFATRVVRDEDGEVALDGAAVALVNDDAFRWLLELSS